MSTPLRRQITRALGLMATLALSHPVAGEAHAQSVGLEAGVAAVENYDGSPNVGVSLFLPFTDRLRGIASYSQWTGCPHNDCTDPRTGYGNRGFNLLALYRVAGGRRVSAAVGAGAGWYEMNRAVDGESESEYREALTFSTELRFPVAFNSSTYLRGDISFPHDDEQPRWGFLRLGVDVGLF